MNKNKSEKEIKIILENYNKSDLSVKQFCSENNIPTPTFYSWLKKVDISNDKLNFVSLSIEEESSKNPIIKGQIFNKIILKTPSGISLELPTTIAPNWLSSLLKDLN